MCFPMKREPHKALFDVAGEEKRREFIRNEVLKLGSTCA